MKGIQRERKSIRVTPGKLTLTYAIVGIAWFLISFNLLKFMNHAEVDLMKLHLLEEAIFILISAFIIYLLAKRMRNTLQASRDSLRQSEQQYQSIVEHNPDAIFAVDARGFFLSANPSALKLMGYNSEELRNQSVLDMFVPEDAERVAHHFKMAKNGQTAIYETTVLDKQGKRIEVSVKNVPIVIDGEIVGVYGIGKDITEVKRAEEELVATREQLKNIFWSLDQVFWSRDANTYQLLQISPACEKIYGYTQQQFFDNPRIWQETIHPDDFPIVQELQAVLQEGRQIDHEYRIINARGETRWVSDRTIPVFGANGQMIRLDGMISDITNSKRAEETIKHMAYHDPLTDLPNRRLFKKELNEALATAKERVNEEMVAVMILDLDRFNMINDSLGHAFGDRLLKAVTERLKGCIPDTCTLARMGGDEFTLFMPILQQECHDVCRLAERILEGLMKEAFVLGDREFFITTSIGIAVFPNDGDDMDTLLKNADTAMYRAKEKGGNNYQFYTPEMSVATDQLELENSLRKALEREELELYYQPKLDLRSDQVVGMEALLRWKSAQFGFVSPLKFIPLAEETGLILPIGEWVLRTACQQNKAWQDAGYPAMRVAVNLSARQFEEDLVAMVARVLEETGLDPAHLELEITESITMNNKHRVVEKLHALKRLGIHIGMDDFGTGYSSLSYLKKFPIDTLKIDKSFVRDITTDQDDAAIVQAVIAMGHSLNLNVVAEGVETEEQLSFLREQDCDEIQGFWFSQPLPVEKFETFLQERKQLS